MVHNLQPFPNFFAKSHHYMCSESDTLEQSLKTSEIQIQEGFWFEIVVKVGYNKYGVPD